jgi:hypothetical protein
MRGNDTDMDEAQAEIDRLAAAHHRASQYRHLYGNFTGVYARLLRDADPGRKRESAAD